MNTGNRVMTVVIGATSIWAIWFFATTAWAGFISGSPLKIVAGLVLLVGVAIATRIALACIDGIRGR